MDREKVLTGLVEHNGAWVTIQEKLAFEREARNPAAPAPAAGPAAPPAAVSAPVTRAVPTFTDNSDDPPIPVIFPQAVQIRKPDDADADPDSRSYEDYVADQKKKTRLLLFGVLIIAVVAGLLIASLLSLGK